MEAERNLFFVKIKKMWLVVDLKEVTFRHV